MKVLKTESVRIEQFSQCDFHKTETRVNNSRGTYTCNAIAKLTYGENNKKCGKKRLRLVQFFRILLEKKNFKLDWLTNFFNRQF